MAEELIGAYFENGGIGGWGCNLQTKLEKWEGGHYEKTFLGGGGLLLIANLQTKGEKWKEAE